MLIPQNTMHIQKDTGVCLYVNNAALERSNTPAVPSIK